MEGLTSAAVLEEVRAVGTPAMKRGLRLETVYLRTSTIILKIVFYLAFKTLLLITLGTSFEIFRTVNTVASKRV